MSILSANIPERIPILSQTAFVLAAILTGPTPAADCAIKPQGKGGHPAIRLLALASARRQERRFAGSLTFTELYVVNEVSGER
jgi:hypothetical protein